MSGRPSSRWASQPNARPRSSPRKARTLGSSRNSSDISLDDHAGSARAFAWSNARCVLPCASGGSACGFSGEEPVKRVGWSIAALCVLAAASAGFTSYQSSYSTPYATPVVEPLTNGDAGTFEGLLTLAENLPPSATLKVLWTHGMCTHRPGWIDDRMSRLVDAVGGTSETVSVRPVGKHGATLRTDRISTRGRAIEVMFLSWSSLTASYKAALAYDGSTIKGSGIRATLNRQLKDGLVNDCLTDVVVYSGPNGNNIRQAMNETVCGALGGRFDGNECDVPAGDSPASLALVTESLGSKLVSDSVLHIWNAANNSEDKTAIKRLANSFAATKVMYMLANQVPLLDAAGSVAMDKVLEPQPPSAPARIRTTAGAVVAFSDPNDLLTYRIVPEHLAEDFGEFRVINVLVSNDTTYFGYLERPDTAHCGYPWNPHVFGMLARGYQAGKPLPSVSVLAGTCPSIAWITGSVAHK